MVIVANSNCWYQNANHKDNNNNNNNSVALVRERTLPNELPLIFGEVSANFSD
jgi:hypothetical protein